MKQIQTRLVKNVFWYTAQNNNGKTEKTKKTMPITMRYTRQGSSFFFMSKLKFFLSFEQK